MKRCGFPGSLQLSLINFVWDIEVVGASGVSLYSVLVQAGNKADASANAGDKADASANAAPQLWAGTAPAVSRCVVVVGLWGLCSDLGYR